ncbi:hypothetical protein SCOCK_90163 [Actinacidiphila cocklensis]|uniref:Uncharacterized protein n=1 Tax=Actinacidiphila cocklensis TaxID=887465 RepID=A0A9W4EBV8_9ACTN|nr:hypothetical protein SCOCK_90163 [Actinacidiphila cocklensis]
MPRIRPVGEVSAGRSAEVQVLARVDQVGVLDAVLVELEELVPAARHVVALGDARQGVAGDDGVVALAAGVPLPVGGGVLGRLGGALGRGALRRGGGLGRRGGACRGGAARVDFGSRAARGQAAGRRAGPGARTLQGEQLLGYRDLLVLGGQVGAGGVLQAAGRFPAGLRELQAAVVAVAGVDRPVATGLALGDGVPGGHGSGRGGRGADQRYGDGGTGNTGKRGESDHLRGTTVLTHMCVPHRRLRGQLSGSDVSCPAGTAIRTRMPGFTPSRTGGVLLAAACCPCCAA